MSYEVLVDDNFHFTDASERTRAGTFATAEEALATARRIVEESVRFMYKPGVTAAELYSDYCMFGEDPFIVPALPDDAFSAWDHAKAHCALLCEGESPSADPSDSGACPDGHPE